MYTQNFVLIDKDNDTIDLCFWNVLLDSVLFMNAKIFANQISLS